MFFLSTVFASRPLQTTNLDTKRGLFYLQKTQHNNNDFANLVRYFQTQQNLAYCGVASAAMVLNSLGVQAPLTPSHFPYRFFDQHNIFSKKVMDSGINPRLVSSQGLTLNQLGTLLLDYGLNVHVYHAASLSPKKTERIITQALQRPHQFVLVNYLRRSVGQKGGGHIVPLAAVSLSNKVVLLMDVATYRYPSVWVSYQTLYSAMNTLDSTSRKSRGFVVVSRYTHQ